MSPSTESMMPEIEDEDSRSTVAEPARADFEVTEHTRSVIDALRAGYRSVEKRGHQLNEAETRQLLIEPVLKALGFPPSHRRPEDGDRGNRPDELCYDRELGSDHGPAAIILEAKALNSDFDTPEQPGRRASSPDRQIQRYLKQHIASGPSTLGILTDGVRWRVYELSGPDVAFKAEFDFGEIARQFWRSLNSFGVNAISRFNDFIEIANRCFAKPEPLMLVGDSDPVIHILNALAEGAKPDEILRRIVSVDEIELRQDIEDQVTLSALQEDTFETDWEEHAYLLGPNTAPEGQLSLSDQMTLAAVQFKHSELGLGRGDTATSARIFARAAGSEMSVLLMYSIAPDGSVEARVASCADGRVNMTAAFDPELPLPSARIAIGRILKALARGKPMKADDVLGPLEVTPLRQQFYREVSMWTWRLQRGKPLGYRQAVLKHLIRVIFAWILKEESIIPPELFEYASAANNLEDLDDYHAVILLDLFHQRLNVLESQRTPHSIDALNEILNRAPFLNGSLFAVNAGDEELDLPNELYWNTDEDTPGLFTIFSRYHWTTDEHRPGESEQTLDPELLSNLFEQLITPTEEGKEPPPRQPRGTYYTPADVADEMVKDALAAAVRNYVPESITDAHLLELFGEPDAPFPCIERDAESQLINRIRELRIFAPAVGSGEFLFSCLIALKSALSKLIGDEANYSRESLRINSRGKTSMPFRRR